METGEEGCGRERVEVHLGCYKITVSKTSPTFVFVNIMSDRLRSG